MLARLPGALALTLLVLPVSTPPRTLRAVGTPLLAASSSLRAQPAPALSAAEQIRFLETARIVSSRPIGKGVTGASRLTLSDGRVTHDAAFQGVDEKTSDADLRAGRRRAGELQFADSYRYNIAAWRLADHLGLGAMMPPTVKRSWNGREGALSWWVDEVLMDETAREAKDIQPPQPLNFARQRTTMAVFAELVRDTDRNKGNIIYTQGWHVVMIDFTRAFRLQHELRLPDTITSCRRDLFAALGRLTRADIDRVAGDVLTNAEMNAVAARRALIVSRLEKLIAERGEAVVLY